MGQELIGRVISQTPTITAGAYSAGDAVGGKLTFKDVCGMQPDEVAIIKSIDVLDLAKQSVALDLALFNADFTATADNDAFDPSDADAAKFIGFIPITNYSDFNDWSMASKELDKLVKPASGQTLYGQLVARGTPTYAATTDLTIRMSVLRG